MRHGSPDESMMTRIWMPSNLGLIPFPTSMGKLINLGLMVTIVTNWG